MSSKDHRGGHNVRFEPRTLDERMEDIFVTSDKLSFPNVQEENKQPDPDAHHFDEADYQLHRKESYPQMHNLLKPMYMKPPRRKRNTSVTAPPPVSESEIPENAAGMQRQKSEELPPGKPELADNAQSPEIDPQQKVQFYIEDEAGGGHHPEESGSDLSVKKPAKESIPSSPSSGSVEALAFQSQSSGEPIPSSIYRHRLDDGVPSDKPTPSLRASEKGNNNQIGIEPIQEITEDHSDHSDNENQKEFKKPSEHKKPHRRRASKQENPIWRQRIGSELDVDSHIPIMDEDESDMLPSIDVDYITSHRFDEVRGARRYKIPSKASLPSFGKGPHKEDEGDGSVPPTKKPIDHKPHEVFVQLNELHHDGGELEWTERARFIKYEEDVEEGVDRWGKPHVASLSFHSLLNLRLCLEKCALLLDLDEIELPAIYNRVVEAMFIKDRIRQSDRNPLLNILMLRHTHMRDKKFDLKIRNYSYHNLQLVTSRSDVPMSLLNNDVEGQMNTRKGELNFVASSEDVRKHDNSILRRIPEGAEAIAVNVGAVDFLEQPAVAFVRLTRGQCIPSVTEVPIPVRFFFILLGPQSEPDMNYHEIGRSISALMKNMHFHQIAYKASERKELLSGINGFLDESIVLPPGDWDKKSLFPVHDIQKKHAEIQRRRSVASQLSEAKSMDEIVSKKFNDPLRRTKRPFGGLVNELKARYSLYLSDIKDALNTQCLAAAIFMYFAALSGAVTFGGLYGEKTFNMVGVTETLLLNSVCGVLFALLSGQPTVIIGPTGPVLLFDESLFRLCNQFGIEFLPLRVWISIWMVVIGIIVVAFEGSALVKFFTRFTQEIFATLISLLFIYEAFYKLYLVFKDHPLISDYCVLPLENRSRFANSTRNPPDSIDDLFNNFSSTLSPLLSSAQEDLNDSLADVGTSGSMLMNNTPSSLLPSSVPTSALPTVITSMLPYLEELPKNQPNTALLSAIMMLGTFFIAYFLRHFRNSKFLGRSVRRALGDFGVPIAIISMAVFDIFLQDTYTMKLRVPEGLSPSNSSIRGWVIPPMGLQKPLPIWQIFMAILPALLLFILFFMETEICQLILRKKLKKGTGFHIDLLLLCVMCLLCGMLGGPWLVAATVRSVTHVSSLTVLSRTHAPGENPKVIDVKDQRGSTLMVYILIGVSVLMARVLRQIPVAVLFGVFLYMGVSSMSGIQFLERVQLLLMPVKHHPDTWYVRKVRTFKMHLYTVLQLLCLIVLWVVKSSAAALAFPFVLILMIPVRRQLSRFFSKQELIALDCDEAEPDMEEPEPDFYEASLMAG